jgi:L-alanine-DL-glutamate epimerase-like enolase superfamily enzyme
MREIPQPYLLFLGDMTCASDAKTAGLDEPRPLVTTFTCPAEDPDQMASTARRYVQAKALKLKLRGDPIDVERVHAVRAARPDVWPGIDANQGLTLSSLEQLMPVLVQAEVKLIEQPFKVGQDALLDEIDSPIPHGIAAPAANRGIVSVTTRSEPSAGLADAPRR